MLYLVQPPGGTPRVMTPEQWQAEVLALMFQARYRLRVREEVEEHRRAQQACPSV